ncbi:MAG TPA: hypothetical protein VHD57_08155 [Vicinamibacterales bacterium]|jgi:hypothetical protein|nr:hypothetical protein [Vicinamibacterales bacterium]
MMCQELMLAHGIFRIEVEERPEMPRYTAHLSFVEDEGHVVRELVFADGRRAEVHATSENLALNSAVTYLQCLFGAPGEPTHGCLVNPSLVRTGPPLVVKARASRL